MAYSEPVNRATGFFVTAGVWNQDLAENQRALFPDQAAATDWDPFLDATVSPSVSVDGAYYRIGALVFLWARFEFSDIATPQGSGTYLVTLPNGASAVNIEASTTAGSGQVVGTWQGRDVSAAAQSHGNVLLRSATTIQFNTTGTGLVNDAAPFAPSWAAFDVLSFTAVIPTA